MKVVTWAPGTNPTYDLIFEELREKHYNDHSHRLWKNYAKEAFADVAVLSIYFDEDNNPEVCSSATQRSCWPNSAYRIHNRVWKCNNKKQFLRKVSPSMGYTAQSQIKWLKENTDCELYFISRQTDNWNDWMITHFKEYGIEFKTDNYMYLTCPNECDDTCWQRIIYNGNPEILKAWKRRSSN
jgi:hypothetical protein